MAYKKADLERLESLVKEKGFTIRYERGSFESGHCIVNDKKIIIINKFFRMKARIDCLEDIIEQLNIMQNPEAEQTLQGEFTALKVA